SPIDNMIVTSAVTLSRLMRRAVSTAVPPMSLGRLRKARTLSAGRRASSLRPATRLEIRPLSAFQGLLGGQGREQVHSPGDDSGPAGVVAGAQASPVVAVEILVKQEAIAPVRVVLELTGTSRERA